MLYFLWNILYFYTYFSNTTHNLCMLVYFTDVICNDVQYVVPHILFSAFAIKCARCRHTVSANDWVRRAGKDVYHLACFACMSCKRQLSTGEEFGLVENQVLCRLHYDIMLLNLRRVSDSGTIVSLISWLQLLLADFTNS